MSSNIKLNRICQHCGKGFIARTTVTQYCSDTCASRAYKERVRQKKINSSNQETQVILRKKIEELKSKEFLTITEACILLSISRWTLWRSIKRKEIKAGKIGRRAIIKRSEIDKLFDSTESLPPQPVKEKKAKVFSLKECYKLKEIRDKYNISDKSLYELIKRNNIPKMKQGWFTYVPKIMIDKLLK